MKLPVIETKHLELEYSGTNSGLINEIFKDIFGFTINGYGMEFKDSGDELKIFEDTSIHGSPCWKPKETITDKSKIELYRSLIKTYELLRKMGN